MHIIKSLHKSFIIIFFCFICNEIYLRGFFTSGLRVTIKNYIQHIKYCKNNLCKVYYYCRNNITTTQGSFNIKNLGDIHYD